MGRLRRARHAPSRQFRELVGQLMSALTEIVLPKFDKVTRSGGSYMVQCPAHEDSSASLSVAEGKEHPVVFRCFAGCRSDDILAALGLDWESVSKPRERTDDRFVQPRRDGQPFPTQRGTGGFVAQYDY